MTAQKQLSRRLYRSFGALLALLLFLVGFSLYNFRRLSMASDWNTHAYIVLLEVHRLGEAINQMDSGVRAFTTSGQERALQEYDAGQRQYHERVRALKKLTADRASHQQRLAKLDGLEQQYIHNQAEPIIAMRRATPDFTRAVLASVRLTPARRQSLNAMMNVVKDFEDVEEKVRVGRSARQEHLQVWTEWTLGLGCVFSILLTGALASLVASSSRQLDETNIRLQQEKMRVDESNAQLSQTNARLNNEIGQRVAAEAKLHRSVTNLQRSNAELEQFAYVASHDLQEPLRAVSGCVQVLQKRYQGQLDARADQFIQHAVDGSLRMQNLINDLLSYSRVGTKGKQFQTVDGESILRGALQSVSVAARESGAHITHDPLPPMICDSGQIEQVLQNLISNAIKFRGDKAPQIHVGCHSEVKQGREFWVLSVKDDGPGIEPQYFERIFVMFQRLHTRSEYPGTGIGLAICKKIVERHGGKIWVESEPQNGSKFSFSLLKQPETENEPDNGPEFAVADGK